MNFIVLVFIFLNALSIFGLPAESVDCINLKAFFSKYPEYKFGTCCSGNNVCDDNGNITSLEVRSKKLSNVDFSAFPQLPHLNRLVLEGKLYNNGVFPSLFFEMPNLKILHVTESNVKSFENIPSTCSLELLSFYRGELTGFPHEVFNCSKLKTLDLSYNNIITIPEDINKLKNLEELLLIDSKLRDLPESIYDMNLKKLHLNKNQILQAKLYKFNNPIEECSLGNTDLSCYEKGACKIILDDPEKSKNEMKENSFKTCETSRSGKNPSSLKLYIIIGSLVVLGIICVVLFALKKKGKNNEFHQSRSREDDPEMSIIFNADEVNESTRSSSFIKRQISSLRKL